MESHKLISTLQEGLNNLKISYSNYIINQLCIYLQKIQEYNKKINLTSHKDTMDIITKDIFDSLAINYVCRLNDNIRLVDIGTGAGLPGIPIKICYPNIHLFLIESSQKKCSFLDNVLSTLNIEKASILNKRAEQIANNKSFRETFDVGITRAVGHLKLLSEIAIPLIKVNGTIIVYKAKKAMKEIKSSHNTIKLMGGKITDTKEVKVPMLDAKRVLITIKKLGSTPLRYPRKFAAIKRDVSRETY